MARQSAPRHPHAYPALTSSRAASRSMPFYVKCQMSNAFLRPGQPVSRVLFGAKSPSAIISLGRTLPSVSSDLPGTVSGASSASFLLGLAPGGVCLSAAVTSGAGALLPRRFTLACPAGHGNLLLCCTVPSGYPAWRLASTVLFGARTFLTPACRGAITRPARTRYQYNTLIGCVAAFYVAGDGRGPIN